MEQASERLARVLESIDRIAVYTEEGQESFLADALIREGVCRNLRIIRKGLAGSDPRLIHEFRLLQHDSPLTGWCSPSEEYYGGGNFLVWSLLEEELSRLRSAVRGLLETGK